MYPQMVLLVPVLLPTLVIRAICDNNTGSDVFVKYSGHAEANYPAGHAEANYLVGHAEANSHGVVDSGHSTTIVGETSDIPANFSTNNHLTTTLPTTDFRLLDETEGVVFVPNEAPVIRLEDEYDQGGVKLRDVLSRRTASDLMDGHIRIETESPLNEIVFVPGSNNENVEKNEKSKEEQSARRNIKEKGERRVLRKGKKLDCSNLDCNNFMKTICGGKIINHKVHYRLFLNDCYFRKVNCNFKFEMNRYTQVPPEKCVKFGARGERPFSFTRKSFDEPKQKEDLSLRKSFSSRRSMSMNVNGEFCSHPCPVSCPEDYEPECAVSATGQRRVFMNHCKLDDNSCLFAIVWHLRPLSECVGGKKADMRQNRFFIGWMRQVGILDNKGKLVLE